MPGRRGESWGCGWVAASVALALVALAASLAGAESGPGTVTTWQMIPTPTLQLPSPGLVQDSSEWVRPSRLVGESVPSETVTIVTPPIEQLLRRSPLPRIVPENKPRRPALIVFPFEQESGGMGDPHYRALLKQELAKLTGELEKISLAVDAADDRAAIARSTWEAGIVSGSNAYDPVQGRLPWMDFHREGCDYFDAKPIHPKTIKPYAVARGHLKSEIGCHALARHICLNPETRNAVFAGSGDRANANVSNVSQILQSPRFQAAYPDVLFAPDGRTGDDKKAYQSGELFAKRRGAWREATLEARGILDDTTGMHVGHNGVCWIDDIVTKQNYRDKEADRIKTVNALIHVLSFIVDPGAQIWMTFTRWGLDDAYATILDPEGMYVRYWCQPDPVIYGCFRVNESGNLAALYPLKYCITPEETDKPVILNGTVFKTPRVSLEVLKQGMETWEWNSQMKNDPQPEEQQIFFEAYFDEKQQLPCDGKDLLTFLDDQNMVRRYIAPPTELGEAFIKALLWLDRGELIPAISGDPSYEEKAHNDYQVLFAILQDRFNNWFVVDGYYERKGYKGLEEYLRWAMDTRDRLSIMRPLGIEAHGKEALKALADRIAREEGRTPIRWAALKANSNQKKEVRIARLEAPLRGRRLYWCKNVEHLRLAAKNEMTKFGAGAKHDDIGDCLANFMDAEVLPPRAVTAARAYNAAKSYSRIRGAVYA